jgi:hypothetical protein
MTSGFAKNFAKVHVPEGIKALGEALPFLPLKMSGNPY